MDKQIIDTIFYEELKQIAKTHNYEFNYDFATFQLATMVMQNFATSNTINLNSIIKKNREKVLDCSQEIAHLMEYR